MIHNWSILCKKSVIEAETNVISLYELIEKISIGQRIEETGSVIVPNEFVMPLDFELVTHFSEISKNSLKPSLKIEVLNQQNEKMGQTEHALQFNPKAKTLRSRVKFNTIKIKGEGTYTFKVSLKENEKSSFKEVANVPLEVEILKPKISTKSK